MQILFWTSAVFVIYVLFGYPMLLAFLAKRRVRPVTKSFYPRSVSVLLPVFNGEAHIRRKLESILALDYPPELLQILVVSDGSEDRTVEIASEYSGRRVRVFVNQHNGKAMALNRALAEATGEILFFTDVRQDLDRESLRYLVSCFADSSVGAVSGELVIRRGDSREEASVGLYWRYEKWIRKQLSSMDSVLGATGCIYAMRRELAVPLPADSLLDDMHQPLAAFFKGYRVILEDQAKAFDYPTALDVEFRRKVRTLAGNYQIIRAYPRLLAPGNRLWIHFMSHKVGRLLLPFALIGIATGSFFLPEWIRGVALAGQAGLYAMPWLDRYIPDSSPAKRFTSIARTFVTMMAAAFCACSIFLVPSRTLWKPSAIGSTKPVNR